jgi:transcriptional regulator with XRE-family HTH domain
MTNKDAKPSSSRKADSPKNTDVSKKTQRHAVAPEEVLKKKSGNYVDDSLSSLFERISGATSSAFKFAKMTGDTSYKVGKAIIQSQDQLKLMVNAGASLKDLREVAGLTINELSEAINLKDKSILEAVENGTATLSFELILRLAALLARNDPIPFILKYTRTYSPETWRILNDWGVGRLPLHYERERQFINIYRSQDKARDLSDEGFNRVLEFTRQAFNLSLHFIGEQEDALQTMLEAQEAQLHVLKSKISRKSKRTDSRKKTGEDEISPEISESSPGQGTKPSRPESS